MKDTAKAVASAKGLMDAREAMCGLLVAQPCTAQEAMLATALYEKLLRRDIATGLMLRAGSPLLDVEAQAHVAKAARDIEGGKL